MTTQEAVDLIFVLQDRYGSPDVEEDEAVSFLNMATYEWLNRLVPSNLGGVVNYELDANVLSNIKPLVFEISGTMSAGGVLTNGVINAALVSAGAAADATWYRIGNIGITISGITYPIKFKKHNENLAHERNVFKKGTATKIGYTIRNDGLKFKPIDSSNTLSAIVIKNPRALSLIDGVDPELDDQNMYNIVALALKLAGVATRDEELIMDVRNTALQTAQ